MRSPCSLFVCVCHELLNGSTSLYEIWYVYRGIWAHFSGLLHKSFSSVSMCHMCVPLLLLGNGWEKMLPQQWIHRTKEELLEASFSMLSMSHQRKINSYFIPEFLVFMLWQQYLLSLASSNLLLCWPSTFLDICSPFTLFSDEICEDFLENSTNIIVRNEPSNSYYSPSFKIYEACFLSIFGNVFYVLYNIFR
jgi:hypothetical protein